MKMDSKKLRSILQARLAGNEWSFTYNRDDDSLRIEDSTSKKGITISLPGIIAKWNQEKDAAIDEVVYYVEESLKIMNATFELTGKEKQIFPVIRSTSFPTESNEGTELIYSDHTAETRVYYALDLGTTYRLIDKKMVESEQWDIERITEIAKFNLRSLSHSVKEDHVAENTFYFLNSNDGYDASKILNETFLQKMSMSIAGTMAVAVPHQDVLIIADIKNDTGYDILAQMTMSFFANGRVPITALSFIYENQELEPIFILGKNRPVNKK